MYYMFGLGGTERNLKVSLGEQLPILPLFTSADSITLPLTKMDPSKLCTIWREQLTVTRAQRMHFWEG